MKEPLDYDSWLYERGYDTYPVFGIVNPRNINRDTEFVSYDNTPIRVPPLKIDMPLLRYLETKIKDSIRQVLG